jgi:hypothetical protein
MIDFAAFEKALEKDMGEVEPELRQLARMISEILTELDGNLLDQDMPEGERCAIHSMVLKALECHMRRLPPPDEEVAFWMQMLNPKVFLPEDSGMQ